MTEFSEKQLSGIRSVFETFSKSGESHVPASEAGTMLRALGLNPTEKEVKAALEKMDPGSSGKIQYDAVVPVVAELHAAQNLEQLKQEVAAIMAVFDRNGTGQVAVADLWQAMMNLGEKLGDDDLQRMVRGAEFDPAGIITCDEFIAKMLQQENPVL